MSENVMIGGNCRELKTGAQLLPYTAVVITVDGKEQFRAENEGEPGRTLTVECPWGSAEIAQQMLEQVGGYTYQPFKASGTKIDPAVELGDAINTYDVHEGLFAQDITFGRQMRSNAEAPGKEDTDHEFPYVPPNTRRMQRLGAAVGGAAKKAEEAEKKLYAFKTGLSESLDFEEDDEGNLHTALVKTAVESAIMEQVPDPKDPEKKMTVLTDAILNLLAVKNEDGSYTSLAEIKTAANGAVAKVQAASFVDKDGNSRSMVEIVADALLVATKKAELNALSVSVDGSLHVANNLYIGQGYDIFAPGGQIVAEELAASDKVTVQEQSFTPKTITSTDGETHSVLGA